MIVILSKPPFEMAASFKTFKIMNQLNVNKKPLRTKIGTNFQGIATPKGIQIKLNKKATVVNNTKTVEVLLFILACFLKILTIYFIRLLF